LNGAFNHREQCLEGLKNEEESEEEKRRWRKEEKGGGTKRYGKENEGDRRKGERWQYSEEEVLRDLDKELDAHNTPRKTHHTQHTIIFYNTTS
jgi:hypothetical protein